MLVQGSGDREPQEPIMWIPKGTDDSSNYLSRKEPATVVVHHPDDLEESEVQTALEDYVEIHPVPPTKLPITSTTPTSTTPTTTTTTTIRTTTTTTTTTIRTTTTTTTSTLDSTTAAGTDDDIDGNTCSNVSKKNIFFEKLEIFDNEEINCSNEFDAETIQYTSCTKAFDACKEITDCIAVTSTHLIVIAPEIDSVKQEAVTDHGDIVNFVLPEEFDFEYDQVFVKKCFSTKETDTDQFTELETLDCNAEVVCSPGYRQKNFDCIDINECKLDHDCTFEGTTFYFTHLISAIPI